MAGGKQTPRQRMVNLMYLVLTCLLALQVSSSIIDKFIFLNQSLEHSLEGARDASENALEALKKKVAAGGNASEGLEKIKRADKLKFEAAKMVGEIDKIKKKLIEESGGIDKKTGNLANPKEETKVEVYMIGREGSKNGRGYDLEKKLNGFVTWLGTEYKDLEGLPSFPKLAEGNQNNPLYKSDPIQRSKDFAQASFGQTPVVAALALLTQKQTDIIRYEQEVLKILGADELTKEVKFDKIVAIASADANIIASGSEYRAEMFISASSSKKGAVMTYNGSPVRVDADGKGEVKFTAVGKGEQEWRGTITIKKSKTADTTFNFVKKYTVVEPVLLVTSASKFPLYQNCANALETTVPALGAAYKPSFSVNNGSAVPGARTGDVTIFPTNLGDCKLTVNSGGRLAGTADFKVLPVPPPTIFLANSQGTQINSENPIPVPRSFKIVAKSDENFANTLPKEANYRVTGVEVFQFRGGRAIQTRKYSSGDIDMSQFQTRPGDGFQFKCTGVIRATSKGTTEPAKILAPYSSCQVR